jgi:hypothetical protein
MDSRTAAQVLGCRGGKARARRLVSRQRQAIASLGGDARALSLARARRVRTNFRYVEAIAVMRGQSKVAVVRKASEPLPVCRGN